MVFGNVHFSCLSLCERSVVRGALGVQGPRAVMPSVLGLGGFKRDTYLGTLFFWGGGGGGIW